jgi:hypothetical protein
MQGMPCEHPIPTSGSSTVTPRKRLNQGLSAQHCTHQSSTNYAPSFLAYCDKPINVCDIYCDKPMNVCDIDKQVVVVVHGPS